MKEELVRSGMLLGEDGLQRLARSSVLLFGVGGVGGYVAEALVRSGLGAITLVDRDTVSLSNLNRQILALHSTVGMPKVAVMQARLADIAPECRITARQEFYLPERAAEFPFEGYDYIVDAVDNVTAKLDIITRALALGVPVISSMGTGNRLDPAQLCITDLAETRGCPLARVMRRELRTRGIEHLKVLASREAPHTVLFTPQSVRPGTPGSTAFVPGAAGLLIAAEVVRDLQKQT